MPPEHLSTQRFLGVISLSSPWHSHRFQQKPRSPHRKMHFTCPTDKMLCSAWYRYKLVTHFWFAGYRTSPLFGSSVWGKATLWFRVSLTCPPCVSMSSSPQKWAKEVRVPVWSHMRGLMRHCCWKGRQLMLARAFLFSFTKWIKCCMNITALSIKKSGAQTKSSWSQSERLSLIWWYSVDGFLSDHIQRKTDSPRR